MSDAMRKQEDEAFKIIKEIQGDIGRHKTLIEKTSAEMGEVKGKLEGYVTGAEFRSKHEKMVTDLKLVDETIRKLSAKNQTLELLNGGKEEKQQRCNDAFVKHLRFTGLVQARSNQSSKFALTDDELKLIAMGGEEKAVSGPGWVEQKAAMSTDHLQRAGTLVKMPEMLTEIINQNVLEISPMRELARKQTTATNLVEVPAQTASGLSYWVGEQGTRTTDETLEFAPEKIPVHEMAVIFQATRQMLEDSAFNLLSYLIDAYSKSQKKLEGTAFTTGNGTQKPQGIMTHSDLVSTNQEEAATITNGLILTKMPFLIKEDYEKNALWMMRRATMGQLATLIGGDGHFLLAPLGQTTSYILKGYPVKANSDMPAIGAGLKPILFGNINEAYMVVDNPFSGFLVDPYTNKTTGLIDYLMYKRVGGQAINIEAVTALNVAA